MAYATQADIVEIYSQDALYVADRDGDGVVDTDAVGREFESSVPWCLNWLFSPDDPFFLKSAAIHDMLLEEGFRRAFADSQWFEAAMSEHAPGLRTWAAYTAMRTRRFALWVVRQRARTPNHRND